MHDESQFRDATSLTREQALWLVIRAVGLNTFVFGVLFTVTSFFEFGLRALELTVAHSPSELTREYTFWAAMRIGVGLFCSAYLLFGGKAAFRLLDSLVPGGEKATSRIDPALPYGPPTIDSGLTADEDRAPVTRV